MDVWSEPDNPAIAPGRMAQVDGATISLYIICPFVPCKLPGADLYCNEIYLNPFDNP